MTTARDRLIRAGIDPREAALDAELLVREIMRWTRAQMLIASHAPAPAGFADEFDALVARRERREPMAYVLGHREFWKLDFDVTPAVLVPRPETELLVEHALAIARRARRPEAVLIADIGTGSGCIAISLARELPRASVVATDISSDALDVARRNARRHGIEPRIRFLEAGGIPDLPGPAIIVSNPPYVPLADRATLAPEVRDYEPGGALFSGHDGLDAIRVLLDEAATKPWTGFMLLELGFGQEAAIRALVAGAPSLRLLKVIPDLQGIPRVLMIQRKP